MLPSILTKKYFLPNEISGLMITGVCGGAIIPPLMGLLTETVGSQVGSLIILTVCAVYLLSLINISGRRNMGISCRS